MTVGRLIEPSLYIPGLGYPLLRYLSRLESTQTCVHAPSCFHRGNSWASKCNRVKAWVLQGHRWNTEFVPSAYTAMWDGWRGSFQSVTVLGYVLEASQYFYKGLVGLFVHSPWSFLKVASKGSSERKISNSQLDVHATVKRPAIQQMLGLNQAVDYRFRGAVRRKTLPLEVQEQHDRMTKGTGTLDGRAPRPRNNLPNSRACVLIS